MDKSLGNTILTKVLSETKEIDLDYENRSFAIEFASFNYNDTNKEVFEYKLEGYDNDWIKTTSRKISFYKIPPGNYIFKVRLLTSAKIPSIVTQVAINVNALWYDTWLAKIIFLFLIIGTVYWLFREILNRDRLKNEIKQERLNVEKQQALNKEKIDFFTNISHDLKTPLTLILDPLKRIEDNKVAAKDREIYFSIVNRNISYLTKLIHQILDFRKAETGKLILNSSSQDFNAFIKECYVTFEFIAIKRNIEFQLHINRNPLYCSLDFEKLQQIIVNVISNAFQYTQDSGLIVFSAGVNEDKSLLEIVIEDNGKGIKESDLEKIFEPFNNIGTAPYFGYSSGIGLSLTKNLIELMKGSISIISKPEKGTKVQISLPFFESNNETIDQLKTEEIVIDDSEDAYFDKTQQIYKPSLLIIEDNPDVQLYLGKELEQDYTLIQVYDGKKGFDAAVQYIPDIIISDIMMPEMDGTILASKLKNNEKTSHIPIIFLTAKGSQEDQIEGFNLGAEAYIMKPFNVEILNAQIKSILENRSILQNRLSNIKKINQLQEEVPTLDNDFLKKVIEIISNNFENTDFNPEKLAQILGISSRQLYRKLKGVTGNTIHEFIIKVKMNKAEELIRTSNFNISEIAYKLGFTESSNFSRTFSKHFGCSPTQFLKQL